MKPFVIFIHFFLCPIFFVDWSQQPLGCCCLTSIVRKSVARQRYWGKVVDDVNNQIQTINLVRSSSTSALQSLRLKGIKGLNYFLVLQQLNCSFRSIRSSVSPHYAGDLSVPRLVLPFFRFLIPSPVGKYAYTSHPDHAVSNMCNSASPRYLLARNTQSGVHHMKYNQRQHCTSSRITNSIP